MESAANGAEKFYTGENNEARYESVEEARVLDKKLIDAWTGHPAFHVVDNIKGQSFQDKVKRVMDCVLNNVGLPSAQTFYKKFLLIKGANMIDIQVPKGGKKEVFQIEEVFLMQTNQSTEAIIRKTGKNDSYVYNHEIRTFKDGQRITTRRQISGREFIEMLEQRKPGYRELKKFK